MKFPEKTQVLETNLKYSVFSLLEVVSFFATFLLLDQQENCEPSISSSTLPF